jgi:hypothetical protein
LSLGPGATKGVLMMVSRRGVGLLLPAVFLLSITGQANRVQAGTHWWLPATVGYTGAATGAGVGLLFAEDIDLENPALVIVPVVGFISGFTLGLVVGKRADNKLARGENLSAAHRNALRVGTTLTGTTVGALVAWRIVEPGGPSSLGTDEEIIVGSLIVGTVLGAAVQFLFFEDALYPPGNPNLGLIFSQNETGIGWRYSF